ncbi:hypothetical protein [Streptomyces sp. A1277]|nr:hypothetical protein [Streptomyces sp. A1277]
MAEAAGRPPHSRHITVGRWGDLRVFSCPADIQHGYEFDVH